MPEFQIGSADSECHSDSVAKTRRYFPQKVELDVVTKVADQADEAGVVVTGSSVGCRNAS